MYDRIQNHCTEDTVEYTGRFFRKVAYSRCNVLKDILDREQWNTY